MFFFQSLLSFWYFSILLIKSKILNILINSSFLFFLLAHSLQITQRTNAFFSKMSDILGLLSFYIS